MGLLCSNLTNGLGVEFGLEELRAVSWQMVGMLELLTRCFVCSLERGEKKSLFNGFVRFFNQTFWFDKNKYLPSS